MSVRFMLFGFPPDSCIAIVPRGPAHDPGVPVSVIAASIQLCTLPGMLTDCPPKSNLGKIEVTQLKAQFFSVSKMPLEMLLMPGRLGAVICSELITLSRLVLAPPDSHP